MLFNFIGLLSQAFDLFSERIWTLNVLVFFMSYNTNLALGPVLTAKSFQGTLLTEIIVYASEANKSS